MKIENKLKKEYKFTSPDNLEEIKRSLGINQQKSYSFSKKAFAGAGVLFASLIAALFAIITVSNSGIPKSDITNISNQSNPFKPWNGGEEHDNDTSGETGDNDQDEDEGFGSVVATTPKTALSQMIYDTCNTICVSEKNIDLSKCMPLFMDNDSYNDYKMVYDTVDSKVGYVESIYENLNSLIIESNKINSNDNEFTISANGIEFNITISDDNAEIRTTINNIYYKLYIDNSDNSYYCKIYENYKKENQTESSYRYRDGDIIEAKFSNSSEDEFIITASNGLLNQKTTNNLIKITFVEAGVTKFISSFYYQIDTGGVTFRIRKRQDSSVSADDAENYVFDINNNTLIGYYVKSVGLYYFPKSKLTSSDPASSKDKNISYYYDGEKINCICSGFEKNDFKDIIENVFSYSI